MKNNLQYDHCWIGSKNVKAFLNSDRCELSIAEQVSIFSTTTAFTMHGELAPFPCNMLEDDNGNDLMLPIYNHSRNTYYNLQS